MFDISCFFSRCGIYGGFAWYLCHPKKYQKRWQISLGTAASASSRFRRDTRGSIVDPVAPWNCPKNMVASGNLMGKSTIFNGKNK